MYQVINTYQTKSAEKLEALRKDAAREIFRTLRNYLKSLQDAGTGLISDSDSDNIGEM